MNTPELPAARARLDAIDRALVSLLAERAAITRALSAWKGERGLPLRDAAREDAMLAERRAWAEAEGLSPWLVEAVTRAVLASTRGLTDEDRALFSSGP